MYKIRKQRNEMGKGCDIVSSTITPLKQGKNTIVSLGTREQYVVILMLSIALKYETATVLAYVNFLSLLLFN
jgi:hypothetical protein